jgi:hypothetical protein
MEQGPRAANLWPAELGAQRWGPPPELVARIADFRKRRVRDGLKLTALGGLALAAGAVSIAPGTYTVATIFTLMGFLLLAVGFWAWRSVRPGTPVSLAVFDNGVLVPETFQSVPGIAKLGGPHAFLKSELATVEDMRRPEGRAVVLRTRSGGGGIVSRRIEGVQLTHQEAERLLDDLLKALAPLGLKAPDQEEADEAQAESDGPSADTG